MSFYFLCYVLKQYTYNMLAMLADFITLLQMLLLDVLYTCRSLQRQSFIKMMNKCKLVCAVLYFSCVFEINVIDRLGAVL